MPRLRPSTADALSVGQGPKLWRAVASYSMSAPGEAGEGAFSQPLQRFLLQEIHADLGRRTADPRQRQDSWDRFVHKPLRVAAEVGVFRQRLKAKAGELDRKLRARPSDVSDVSVDLAPDGVAGAGSQAVQVFLSGALRKAKLEQHKIGILAVRRLMEGTFVDSLAEVFAKLQEREQEHQRALVTIDVGATTTCGAGNGVRKLCDALAAGLQESLACSSYHLCHNQAGGQTHVCCRFFESLGVKRGRQCPQWLKQIARELELSRDALVDDALKMVAATLDSARSQLLHCRTPREDIDYAAAFNGHLEGVPTNAGAAGLPRGHVTDAAAPPHEPSTAAAGAGQSPRPRQGVAGLAPAASHQATQSPAASPIHTHHGAHSGVGPGARVPGALEERSASNVQEAYASPAYKLAVLDYEQQQAISQETQRLKTAYIETHKQIAQSNIEAQRTCDIQQQLLAWHVRSSDAGPKRFAACLASLAPTTRTLSRAAALTRGLVCAPFAGHVTGVRRRGSRRWQRWQRGHQRQEPGGFGILDRHGQTAG